MKIINKHLLLGIHSEAIGHFVRETEILDLLIQSFPVGNLKSKVILCSQKRISNRFFLDIISESYSIVKWPVGRALMRIMNRISTSHKAKHDFFGERSTDHLSRIHSGKSRLLNSRIQKEIDKHLSTHIQELKLENYVIFAIRDSGYDLSRFEDFDLRDEEYRNTPINFFLPTFQYFKSKNVSIIRVGRHNNTSINSYAPEALEISSIECKFPDLCDFAIFSGAKTVYSTGTGVDEIGLFLRKPTIYINVSPFGTVAKSPLIKAVLASDYFDGTGKRLSLNELLENNLHVTRPVELIKQGKLQIRPKSAKSILAFISAFEEAPPNQKALEVVHSLARSGAGEQWENVLY